MYAFSRRYFARGWRDYLVFGLLVVGAIGCDPSFRYHPVGWQDVLDNERILIWEGVEFRALGAGGLTGSSWIDPEFIVRNSSNLELKFRDVSLEGAGGEYQGEILGSRIIGAKEDGRIVFTFDLGKEATGVLGHTCLLDINLLLGEEDRVLVIRYSRSAF